MRYLATALIAEGPFDDLFLPPLLTRALTDICLADFEDSVDVADVLPLRAVNRPHSVPETLKLVSENAGSFNVVIFQRDQGANTARVRDEWLGPLMEQWGDRPEQLVRIVPVRETEAWMLADGDALRRVLGLRWPDKRLGVPDRPKAVEEIPDPKKPLRDLGAELGRPIDRYFERLGELVSLSVLASVPAFAWWRREAVEALTALGLRRRYP